MVRDVLRVVGKGRPGDLDVERIVVATVYSSTPGATVTPAPAPAWLGSEGGAATEADEVLDALGDLFGIDDPAVSRYVAYDVELVGRLAILCETHTSCGMMSWGWRGKQTKFLVSGETGAVASPTPSKAVASETKIRYHMARVYMCLSVCVATVRAPG